MKDYLINVETEIIGCDESREHLEFNPDDLNELEDLIKLSIISTKCSKVEETVIRISIK